MHYPESERQRINHELSRRPTPNILTPNNQNNVSNNPYLYSNVRHNKNNIVSSASDLLAGKSDEEIQYIKEIMSMTEEEKKKR